MDSVNIKIETVQMRPKLTSSSMRTPYEANSFNTDLIKKEAMLRFNAYKDSDI
jgi:hypothetical protein